MTYQFTPPVKCLFHHRYSGGNTLYSTKVRSCHDSVKLSWYQWHPSVTLSVCNYRVCPCLMCQYIRDSQIFTPLLVSVYFTSPTPNPLHQNHNSQSHLGQNMLIVFTYPTVLGSVHKSYGCTMQIFGETAHHFPTFPPQCLQQVQFVLVQSTPCRCSSISVSLSA